MPRDDGTSGSPDLVIVGAGPAGLATAIAASRAGLDYVVLEKGALVESIFTHAVFLLTSYHPDVDLLRGAGARVDPDTLKPQIDPESLETNVAGLYVAGALASGRETGRIFIENGRFHGEAIVRSLLARRSAPSTV